MFFHTQAKMKYLKDCSFHVLLVLLLMIRGSLCVPALDAAPPAATPNTVEESENLVEGSGEPVVAPTDVVPAASNDTTPPAEGNSEAAVVSFIYNFTVLYL